MAKKIFGSIVPSVEKVEVNGVEVETRGLKVDQIVTLYRRFPEVLGVFEKGVGSLADNVIDAIIAMATGADQDEEADISRLPLSTKAAFVSSIVRQTMPDGPGPFVELLNTLRPDAGGIKLRSTQSSQQPPISVFPASEA